VSQWKYQTLGNVAFSTTFSWFDKSNCDCDVFDYEWRQDSNLFKQLCQIASGVIAFGWMCAYCLLAAGSSQGSHGEKIGNGERFFPRTETGKFREVSGDPCDHSFPLLFQSQQTFKNAQFLQAIIGCWEFSEKRPSIAKC
jgi:hypothetical protein